MQLRIRHTRVRKLHKLQHNHHLLQSQKNRNAQRTVPAIPALHFRDQFWILPIHVDSFSYRFLPLEACRKKIFRVLWRRSLNNLMTSFSRKLCIDLVSCFLAFFDVGGCTKAVAHYSGEAVQGKLIPPEFKQLSMCFVYIIQYTL
jgi:hypothetical protein